MGSLLDTGSRMTIIRNRLPVMQWELKADSSSTTFYHSATFDIVCYLLLLKTLFIWLRGLLSLGSILSSLITPS